MTERIFDFSAILAIFYAAKYLAGEWHTAFNLVNGFAALMLMAIVGCFFIAEEMLDILHRVVLARYTTRWSVWMVKTSGQLVRAIRDIKSILHRRFWACTGFTLLIWGLEVVAFAMFWQVLKGQLDAGLFLAALVFLSSLLPSGPVGYGGVQLAFHWVGEIWQIPGLVAYSLWYNVFIFVPALAVALIVLLAGMFKARRDVYQSLKMESPDDRTTSGS